MKNRQHRDGPREQDDLPEGWAPTMLGELIMPATGKVEPANCPTARYLSLEHLESGSGNILGYGLGSDVHSTKAVFRAGDVLYGKLRPYLNKVAIPDFDGICSTDILVFPRSKWLVSEFLRYYLSTPLVVRYANHNSSGVQLPRISFGSLSELEFPLPPLAEQKRIVAKVEMLLARVNAARQRLAKVPALLKRFRQSVLAAACSGELTANWRAKSLAHANHANGETTSDELPDSWQLRKTEEVCSDIVDCPHSTPKWTESGEICLRTTNFRVGQLDLSEVRYVSGETFKHRIARLAPRPSDVVYSREGGILGIACMIPTGLKTCLGQRMMLLRAGDSILPSFLMNVLNSPRTVDEVKELTGGTASPHLNVGDVKQFDVPVPPLAEQHEIVRRVEALLTRADRIEKRLATATRRVEALTQAILAQAFRGELVPTEAELARQEGRDYEPAAILLERIRTLRTAADPAKKPRR